MQKVTNGLILPTDQYHAGSPRTGTFYAHIAFNHFVQQLFHLLMKGWWNIPIAFSDWIGIPSMYIMLCCIGAAIILFMESRNELRSEY